jgi:hypothetical protein
MTVYPGDDLVPDATIVIDRWLNFHATPAEMWPWLVQLGKRRAGWYMPRAVERFIPPSRRAVRTLVPTYLRVEVGDDTPDWGPGDPVFRLAALEPDALIAYLSLRDRDFEWRWPSEGRPDNRVLRLSWTLRLTAVGTDSTSLHIRLRVATSRGRFNGLVWKAGEFFDLLTIKLLHRGLAERLADHRELDRHRSVA